MLAGIIMFDRYAEQYVMKHFVSTVIFKVVITVLIGVFFWVSFFDSSEEPQGDDEYSFRHYEGDGDLPIKTSEKKEPEEDSQLRSDRPEIEPTEPIVAGEETAHERPEGVGPQDWMAPATDVDEEALRERLDNGEMDQGFELARREDRRRSTRLAEDAVRECHGQSQGAQGRVALEWTMRTAAGEGVIDSPEIILNRGLEEPLFEQCVIDRLSNLSFDATGDDADLSVRWVVSLP